MHRSVIVLVVLALAGCGESKPTAPSKLDAADVAASAQRVISACQDGGAGAEETLEADVDRLVAVYERSDPDARFQLEAGSETTTMRTILTAVHNLLHTGPCSVALDEPVARALGDD